MPENSKVVTNSGLSDLVAVGNKLSDAAGQIKDKVTDFGRATADKLNENRHSTANGLDKAAAALHVGGDKVSHVAHATAEDLSATAEYVRGHDLKKMMGDVGKLVKDNPVPSLLLAAAIGFLAGKAFSGRD
jgi:ElaB/YqjD/DUF883 family membrane-anchored ribosome-binding protein